MFRRILLACRGDAAARVARTCRHLGIATVAAVSEADADLGWLAEVDQRVCVGGAHPRDSYLNADAILEVARGERCSAIHPGWGFLAENPVFAMRCALMGIAFVGPSASVLARLADKIEARRFMARHGLPGIPGSDAPVASLGEARVEAERLGYPVLLKARAGAGGRGIRRVDSPADLRVAMEEASMEVTAAFGSSALYMERHVERARHIEFQVVVDRFGRSACLGSRECSIQRNFQKVIEEAPAPCLSTSIAEEVGERAARALAGTGYVGLCTVEMLRDAAGRLHFLECNPRLQVEHAVTEATVGVDLVELQFRMAAGHALPNSVRTARPTGHAIECRLNAEDPALGFRPSPGVVESLDLPMGDGIRVDTHLRPPRPGMRGDRIPPHYDSLVAKIIATGQNRKEALERLRGAVDMTRIRGMATNHDLLVAILAHPAFRFATYDVEFLESHLSRLLAPAFPMACPESRALLR